MAKIKIVIVDDHEMVRNGLSVMIEKGGRLQGDRRSQ